MGLFAILLALFVGVNAARCVQKTVTGVDNEEPQKHIIPAILAQEE